MTIHRTVVCLFVLTLLSLTMAVMPANAQVLYTNGTLGPGDGNGWTINFGFWVENSFMISSPATVNHVDFVALMSNGDQLRCVDWAIFAAGGKVGHPLAQGTTCNLAIEYVFLCNAWCPDLEQELGFDIPALPLPAGKYYLRLQNAKSALGNPVYWSENNGPSTAYDSEIVGTIPSEWFDIRH